MADGTITLRTDVDTGGVSAGLGKIKSAAGKVGKAFAAAGAAGAAAFVSMGKAAISSYGDYEQLVGGVETLFKESSDIVMKYAENAYEAAGLSANEYMETITSFSASLLQSLGNDTAKAAEYGNQAVVDMSDNANKMGTDISRIQDAYQGFAKQNFTMLDNLKLGYGGTKTEMERLLKDAEKLKAANGEVAKYSIDSFADIVEAIHVVQNNMGITGTTAKEAATTIQGSFNMVKSSWKNVLTGIADETQDFNKLLDDFVSSTKTFAKNILPRIKTVFSGIPKLIKGLLPEAEKTLQSFMPQLLSAGLEGAKGLSGLAKAIIKTLPKVVSQAAPQIISVGADIAKNLVDGIITGLNELSPALTVAATTLFSVFSVVKIAPIVSGMISGFQAINATLTAYQAAVATSEHVTVLLASTMKPLELIFGVLTGKVSLATAAQVAWNAAMSINPAVLVIGGIAALAGAVTGVVLAYDKYLDEHSEVVKATREMAEAAKEAAQQALELKSAFESATESAADTISNAEAEAYANEKLADELYDLADKTDKTADEKQRMKSIVDQLNGSIDGLNLSLDEETGTLNLTKDAVKDLISKKLELARTNAIQDLYTEQLKNQYKAQQEAIQAAEGLKRAQDTLNSVLAQGEEVGYNYGGTVYKSTQYTREQQKAIKEAKEAIKKYSDALHTSHNTATDAYSDMQALAQAAGIEIPAGFESGQKDMEAFFINLYFQLQQTEATVAEEGAAIGEGTVGAIASGAEKNGDEVTGAVNSVIKSAASGADTSGFETVGGFISQGIASGITSGTISVANAIKGVISSALATAKATAYIASPSKLFRDEVGRWIAEGIAVGITDNADAVEKAMAEMLIDAAKADWLRRLDLAERFDSIKNMQNEQIKDMLDSEKFYYTEKRRLELEAEEKEYKERLASAKSATEIAKIKRERIEEQQKKSDQAYLEALKETAENERKINEVRAKQTESIVDSIKTAYQSLTDEIMSSIEALQSKQEDFAKKLAGIGSTFKETAKDIVSGYVSAFSDQGNRSYANLSTTYINSSVTKLKQYREMLLSLRDREDVPQDFYEYVKSLDLDKGYQLLSAINRADDKQLQKYIQALSDEKEALRDVAQARYQDEIAAEETAQKHKLTDWNAETEAVKEYTNTLEAVKERAGDAEGFFDWLRDKDIKEGFEEAKSLLELSDADFEQYINDFERHQETLKKRSKMIYRDEADELSREISDKFNETEREFFGIGTDAATQFEGGFMQRLQDVIQKIRETLGGAFNDLLPISTVSAIGDVVSIPVPAMATGGIVPYKTLAMVGERGREAVLPLENNTQWMDVLADKVAARTGGGQTPVILQLDGRELGRAVINTGNSANRILGTKLVVT